jgi:anti-sigma regulatory factor (Ser/Thr protein kinase)
MQLTRLVARTFGRRAGEVSRARHLMDGCLDALNAGDEDRAALVLVVSELVSNAVRHARSSVELYVYASDTVIRIEVWDRRGGQPHVRPVERSGPQAGGWGLRLVDQLVDQWGTIVHLDRTVIWVQRTIRSGPLV